MFHRAILLVLAVTALGGCSNDTNTGTSPQSFNPGAAQTDGGGGTSGGPGTTPGTTDGGCPNKPAGCFCGTPTTQQQWLNRCTTSAALPVTLTPKLATTADIP